MTDTILTQAAFLLHARPYRDSSYLLDVLTAEYGRIALIARGARSSKSKLKSTLQAFTPLLISCRGQGELMLMTGVEPAAAPYLLTQDRLIAGLYVNELIVRLLARQSPSPSIFVSYQDSIRALADAEDTEIVLRHFEKHLLQELGYGLPSQDVMGNCLQAEGFYQYHAGEGFVPCLADANGALSGEHILAVLEDDYSHANTKAAAKRLMRRALAPLLGSKPLKSRELFYVKD